MTVIGKVLKTELKEFKNKNFMLITLEVYNDVMGFRNTYYEKEVYSTKFKYANYFIKEDYYNKINDGLGLNDGDIIIIQLEKIRVDLYRKKRNIKGNGKFNDIGFKLTLFGGIVEVAYNYKEKIIEKLLKEGLEMDSKIKKIFSIKNKEIEVFKKKKEQLKQFTETKQQEEKVEKTIINNKEDLGKLTDKLTDDIVSEVDF